MTNIVTSINYTSEAISRLATQYADADNLKAFISAYTIQLIELEAMFFSLIDVLLVESAEGVQLDMIGNIIGVLRDGLSDVEFRPVLSAQIRINLSSGEADSILEVLSLMPNINLSDISLSEYYPAAIEVDINTVNLATTPANIINDLVHRIKAGGVLLNTLYNISATNTFTFAANDGSSVPTSATEGFGDDTLTTGGQFASAITFS